MDRCYDQAEFIAVPPLEPENVNVVIPCDNLCLVVGGAVMCQRMAGVEVDVAFTPDDQFEDQVAAASDNEPTLE